MNNSESVQKTKVNFIEPNKSTVDKKHYRCFTLPNEMKITIISDPETDKAAAAMDVNIGSLSDPRHIMGLAHFCEHMVFLGSEKYPEENYYSKYLSQNNGQYNAYTATDRTNFYFEIKPENLQTAIDIFAQFFISPLFTESATDRELQAVNSEHEKNVCIDGYRNYQLERHLSDKNHDHSKFATGNLKTLKEDLQANNVNLREALLDFHGRHYSSNIMSLCILGKEPLDVIQQWVLDLFSPVVNKHTEIPYWDTHPWPAENLQQLVYVTPIRDYFELIIYWPIPDYNKLYTSKPHHYASHLIGHEGPGSILILLKKKGWAHKLSVGPSNPGPGFAHLQLSIGLFEEGLNHIDEIITIIYQYCAILKSEEPHEWIFNEEKKINEMLFRFHETSDLQTLVSQVSANMRKYNTEHVLEGAYLLNEFRPDLIKTVIDCLVPSQMKVFCVAKKFESMSSQEETWYGTKYHSIPFSSEQKQMWEQPALHPELFLPGQNKFIATDFTIKVSSPSQELASAVTPPELIRNTPLSMWWYARDSVYLLPKAHVSINLANTLSLRDPVSSVMNMMLAESFADFITEHIYDATLANLEFVVRILNKGIKCVFNGFNDKMSVFVADIMTKLVTFVPEAGKFDAIKEKVFRTLRNFEADQPIYQAEHFLSCLISEVTWSKADLLSTIDLITYENFLMYLKTFFSQFRTEALIYGNFRHNEAVVIMNEVDAIFTKYHSVKPLVSSQITVSREVLLPDNSNYVFQYNNHHQPTSAIVTYLQTESRSHRSSAILKLMDEILSEPLYNRLRTEEQLGYIVGCSTRQSNMMQGLRIYLQSMKTPAELDDRVQTFLQSFHEVLREMPEPEFNKYVVSLQNRLLERPKDMIRQAIKYWEAISSNHFTFTAEAEEARELDSVTKPILIDYYEKFVDPNSNVLKKLSIYINSEVTHGPAGSVVDGENQVTLVDNAIKFKSGLPLSPIFEPVLPAMEMPTAKL